MERVFVYVWVWKYTMVWRLKHDTYMLSAWLFCLLKNEARSWYLNFPLRCSSGRLKWDPYWEERVVANGTMPRVYCCHTGIPIAYFSLCMWHFQYMWMILLLAVSLVHMLYCAYRILMLSASCSIYQKASREHKGKSLSQDYYVQTTCICYAFL